MICPNCGRDNVPHLRYAERHCAAGGRESKVGEDGRYPTSASDFRSDAGDVGINEEGVTYEPIGCIECMPEEAPAGVEAKGMKFYFTYGAHGQAYEGGWTEVVAPDIRTAFKLFEALHPINEETGLYPYSDHYTEESFRKTSMYKNGNFGKFCNERIVMEVM